MRWANKIEREENTPSAIFTTRLALIYTTSKYYLETLTLSHVPSVSPSSL